MTDADDREVLEYDGAAGTEENWYAYGLGPNDVLNQMNLGSNTRETMLPDVQGSVIATLDAGSGALANAGYQTFDEHPSLTSGTFRYTAQRFDPETAGSTAEPSGLYYYRARMYSPTLGRFLQPDPGGYRASGVNLYAYVGNDPLNFTDPNGQCPWCIGAAIGGIGGGISGGIAGYNSTGTWQGAALGAAGGAAVGATIGVVNPLAVGYAIEAAGGAGAGVATYVAGAAAFTAVNAVGGVAGAATGDVLDYEFAGGSLSNLGTDVSNGAIIGAASGILELPFAAAGGAEALGAFTGADAALSSQSAIFGVLGTIAATCSTSTGCGPSSSQTDNLEGTNINWGNTDLSNINIDLSGLASSTPALK